MAWTIRKLSKVALSLANARLDKTTMPYGKRMPAAGIPAGIHSTKRGMVGQTRDLQRPKPFHSRRAGNMGGSCEQLVQDVCL